MSYTNKQIKKLLYKKCFFCDETNKKLLDAHRIFYDKGKDVNTYNMANMLVLCANCHRLVHGGDIKVDRKYNSTAGTMVHYFREGKEFWELEKPG